MSALRLVLVFTVLTLAAAVPTLAAQEKPTALAGKWNGSVKADIGEMAIAVSITVDGETIAGEIKNMHGAFRITKGERQKDGRWKLSFTTEDGAAGALTGAVKDDAFTGDWDFRPNAVGTFALTRAK